GREHKAWGVSPRSTATPRPSPRKRAKAQCLGSRVNISQTLSPVTRASFSIPIIFLGLTPQALRCHLLRRFSTNELITAAVNGKNETRLLRIWFQLLPEMDDMRVHGARVWIVLITPYLIQKPIASERLRRMRDEVCQQRELFR